MKMSFLLDENLMPDLKTAIWRHETAIDVLRVGDSGAPPYETLDPQILIYLETSRRCLITSNRKSMPATWQSMRQQAGIIGASFACAARRRWGN